MFRELRAAASPQGQRSPGLGSNQDGLASLRMGDCGTTGCLFLSSDQFQFPRGRKHGLRQPQAYGFSHQKNKPLSPAPFGKRPRGPPCVHMSVLGPPQPLPAAVRGVRHLARLKQGDEEFCKGEGILPREARSWADGLSCPRTRCLFILGPFSYPCTSASSNHFLNSNRGSASEQDTYWFSSTLGQSCVLGPFLGHVHQLWWDRRTQTLDQVTTYGGSQWQRSQSGWTRRPWQALCILHLPL